MYVKLRLINRYVCTFCDIMHCMDVTVGLYGHLCHQERRLRWRGGDVRGCAVLRCLCGGCGCVKHRLRTILILLVVHDCTPCHCHCVAMICSDSVQYTNSTISNRYAGPPIFVDYFVWARVCCSFSWAARGIQRLFTLRVGAR